MKALCAISTRTRDCVATTVKAARLRRSSAARVSLTTPNARNDFQVTIPQSLPTSEADNARFMKSALSGYIFADELLRRRHGFAASQQHRKPLCGLRNTLEPANTKFGKMPASQARAERRKRAKEGVTLPTKPNPNHEKAEQAMLSSSDAYGGDHEKDKSSGEFLVSGLALAWALSF